MICRQRFVCTDRKLLGHVGWIAVNRELLQRGVWIAVDRCHYSIENIGCEQRYRSHPKTVTEKLKPQFEIRTG